MVRNWSNLICINQNSAGRLLLNDVDLEKVDFTSRRNSRLFFCLHLIRFKKWKRFYLKNYLVYAFAGAGFSKIHHYSAVRWEFAVLSILLKNQLTRLSYAYSLTTLLTSRTLYFIILKKSRVLFFIKKIGPLTFFGTLNYETDRYYFLHNLNFFVRLFSFKHFSAQGVLLNDVATGLSWLKYIRYNNLFTFNKVAFGACSAANPIKLNIITKPASWFTQVSPHSAALLQGTALLLYINHMVSAYRVLAGLCLISTLQTTLD